MRALLAAFALLIAGPALADMPPAVVQLQLQPGASASTFWRGDGTWGAPATGVSSGTFAPGDNAVAANYIQNANPAYLQYTRAALAKVRAQLGSARVLFVGDSTTFGSYSSATASLYKTHGFPTILGQMLSGAGLIAQDNSLIGFGNSTSENAGSNDSRFTKGAGIINAGVQTTGGNTLLLNAAGAASVFAPTGQTLGFKVWFITTTGGGTFSVSVDGGAATNVNANAANNLTSQTFSASLSTHTISLSWVSGGNVLIAGIEGIPPSTGIVDILNAGWPGSTAGGWNAGSGNWTPVQAITSYAPDVTFIDLGINDWLQSESLSTYTASMQAIITAAKTTGDCVVVTPAPTATNVTSPATQAQYTAAAKALALSSNCIVVDGYSRWGSYETVNPLGFYANTVHPGGQGYADWAQPYFSLLMLQ